MSCNSVQSKLSAYVDGEMSAVEMQSIKSHVANCNECMEAMVQYRAVRATLRDLPGTPDPSEGLPDRILRNISASKRVNYRLAFMLAVPALAVAVVMIARTPRAQTPNRDVAVRQELARDQFIDASSDPMSGATVGRFASFESR